MKKQQHQAHASFWAVLLIAILPFAFTACGGSDSGADNQQEPTEVSETDAGEAEHLESDSLKQEEHPAGDGEHPAGNGEHPAGDGEHPAGNGEHPAGGGEHPDN